MGIIRSNSLATTVATMEPSDATSSSSTSFEARVDPGNIRTLILEKEKELHDINEYRIRTLEALLRDQEFGSSAAKQKLSKLQEDFKYNLKLLEGRDEELALYDASFATLKNVVRDREIELSESKAREAEAQAQIKQLQQIVSDSEAMNQQKLKDARAQIEGARWKFDDELRRQEEAIETLRRNGERQMSEKEEEIDIQRRDLTVTFDTILRQREVELKQTSDELKSHLREVEVKNKALTRDAECQRGKVEELKTKNQTLQQVLQEKEKEFTALEWATADENAAKDVKLGEAEHEVVKLTEVKQRLLDEYESKMAELVQSLHAVEKAFVHQKTHFEEEVQNLMDRTKREANIASIRNEAKVKGLCDKLCEKDARVEALQAELKQSKWDANDRVTESEHQVDRMQSALQALEDQHQQVTKDMQTQLCIGERETQILQARLHESHRQLSVLKEKDKTQRHELLEGVEKQESLQRDLALVHSRWETRWQQQHHELDEQHNTQIQELKQAHERLVNQNKSVEERLAHATNEVQRLRLVLSSRTSTARISESLSSQFVAGATRQSKEVRHSSDSVPVPLSPLWSDDPGELSPVPSMSRLPSDSSQFRGEAMAQTSASALEHENAKLRDIIRQMKDSLTRQAAAMEASPGHGCARRNASNLAAQLLEAQERCVALGTQLNEKSTQVIGLTLQLESCKQELVETQRAIKAKKTQIEELKGRVVALEEAQTNEGDWQTKRVDQRALVTDLKQKLEAATFDIDRLVRERGQLMELSNQLRADLRRQGLENRSKASTLRVEFAEKRDYETMIADLTQSLEDARAHNKTLKKELRRMVKAQVRFQAGGRASDDDKEGKHQAIACGQADPDRHRSSTLSMMKSLNPTRSKPRSSLNCEQEQSSRKKEVDEQLLTLARNKRPKAQHQAIEARANVATVPSDDAEYDFKAKDSGVDPAEGEMLESETPPFITTCETAEVGNINARGGGSSSAKVTDARLKLYQAKEMLLLAGKRVPIAESRASFATLSAQTATATRVSDRETSSQRSAVRKLKQQQTKRAEMMNARKNVRNYSLA